jgi:hypothetical protein
VDYRNGNCYAQEGHVSKAPFYSIFSDYCCSFAFFCVPCKLPQTIQEHHANISSLCRLHRQFAGRRSTVLRYRRYQ